MRNFLSMLVLAAALLSGCSQPSSAPSAPSASPSDTAAASPSSSASPERRERRRGFDPERFQEMLSLTDEQMAELKPLFEEQKELVQKGRRMVVDEMKKLLTPEQLGKLDKMERPEWDKLELTGEQATRLEELRQKSREEMRKAREAFNQKLASKLTKEQQARLKEMRQRRGRDREED